MTKGFDSRIKSIKDIHTVITADQSLVGQTGYFENSVSCFSDLKNCRYGKLTKLYEYGDCINEYCFECDNSDSVYEFFIPESVLKTEEKKYIPFSLAEWTDRFAIGDTIIMRQSNCTFSGQPYTTYHYMYEGFCYDSDETWGVPNTGYIMLGGEKYAFDQLLQEYELLWHGTWQPFGMVKEK